MYIIFWGRSNIQGSLENLSLMLRARVSQETEEIVSSTSGRNNSHLPNAHTVVKPCFANEKYFRNPSTIAEECSTTVSLCEEIPLSRHESWLHSCCKTDGLPWSVFYSRKAEPIGERSLTRTAVLPMFSEQSHDIAMMAHSMQVVKNVTDYLNPGRTPVLVVDQPFFALCKIIQYLNVNSFDQNNSFIIFPFPEALLLDVRCRDTIFKWD